MRVYKGTAGSGEYERPARWIEPRTTWEWELEQLIDGLCSAYYRNRVEGDDPLPERLSLSKVIEVVKDEYERYGTNAVWTWSDGDWGMDTDKARRWARGIILAVLPEIEVEK